jgi:hypothetical protein
MIGKIINRTPGIYLHISFKTLFLIIFFTLFIAILCIQSVHVSLNPPPQEYPMFIDGKKIVFLGREPLSVMEAREIIARFDRHIKDGARVLVPADVNGE